MALRNSASTIVFLMLGGLLATVSLTPADDDKHHKRQNHSSDETLRAVSQPVYQTECGGCHQAYQPDLLPSGSWSRLLDGLDQHFGETVQVEPKSLETIRTYLTQNAADRSHAELARKIMHSLHGQIPLRISDVPYIHKEHHDLAPDVYRRASIGSPGNCVACHRGAENGDYDDDDVVIPE